MTIDTKKSSGGVRSSAAPDDEELRLISGYVRNMPPAEELYTFRMLLCDNDIDRDTEAFGDETLEALSKLFVGKTGIFDHNWSAHEQVARIYMCRTEENPQILTADGRPYKGLFAKAYMVKTPGNQELISAIEAGILKEVSISCGIGRRVCSVCGGDYGSCSHEKGKLYDGKLCHVALTEPRDAYEWSFVAVPAQRQAGVIKAYGKGDDSVSLREYLEKSQTSCLPELEKLEKEAELGRHYLEELKARVVRLGGLCSCGLTPEMLGSIADRLEPEQLESLQKSYQQQADRLFPSPSQLAPGKSPDIDCREDYLI